MKRKFTFMAVIAIALSLAISVGAFGANNYASAEETQAFLTETYVAWDYTNNAAAITYQGENGMYIRGGSYTGNYMLKDENGVWTGNGATVSGAKFAPGKNGVTLEWKASSAANVSFSGIVYNAVAFKKTDMSELSVPDRTETTENRDGVTVKAYLYTAANEITTLYEKTYNTDFVLYADGKTYVVGEGDRFIITIESNQTTTADETYIYLNAYTSSVVASYDFTKEENYADGVLADVSGNGNYMRFGPNFPTKTIDEQKGLYFEGFDVSTGSNLSKSFLYNPNYTTKDYTDSLTDFSIKMNFTLENKAPKDNVDSTYYDRFQYLISTTSSVNSAKGFAIRTESMGDTADGKTLYALKLCIADGNDFHFAGGAWITTLAGGESYELILNVSTTKKLAEMFVYGTYYVEGVPVWAGRNRTDGTPIAASWTMDNSGEFGNGLTIGAKDEAGQEGFKGWMKDLTVYDYCQTMTASDATRPGTFGKVSVTNGEAINQAEYYATEAEIINELNDKNATVLLNTDATTQVTGNVTWKEVVFDGVEYYALGTVKAHGVYNEAVKTVKTPVKAYVAKVMYNGECVQYITCANDGTGKFVKPQSIAGITGDYVYTYYADAEKAVEFDFESAVSENTVIYVEAILRQYTITYVLDGGVQNENNLTVYNKETGTITFADPTKEGFVFDGWYIDNEQKVTFIDSSKAEDITLYARWTEISNEPETSEPGEEGCVSSIACSWIGIALVLGAACVLKKKDN